MSLYFIEQISDTLDKITNRKNGEVAYLISKDNFVVVIRDNIHYAYSTRREALVAIENFLK